MSPLDRYPYSNIHTLNLDWILDKVKQIETEQESIRSTIYTEIDKAVKSLSIRMEYTPKTFGAKGDGITNDTKAFNIFIEFLATTGNVGYISPGTYLVEEIGYRKPGNISISGYNKNNCIISHIGNLNGFRFDYCNSVFIENVTIDMNHSGTETRGSCLYFNTVDYFKIKEINLINFHYNGLLAYPIDNSKELKCDIENVYIKSIGEKEPSIPSGIILTSYSNSLIKYVVVENVSKYPIELKNYSHDCIVENCVVRNCSDGIYLGGDAEEGPPYCNNIIFNNIIHVNSPVPFIGSARNIVLSNIICGESSSLALTIRNCSNVLFSCLAHTVVDVRNSDHILGIIQSDSASRTAQESSCTEALYIESGGVSKTIGLENSALTNIGFSRNNNFVEIAAFKNNVTRFTSNSTTTKFQNGTTYNIPPDNLTTDA